MECCPFTRAGNYRGGRGGVGGSGEGIAVAAFLRTAFEVECTLMSALACSYMLSSSRGALGLAG